MTGDIRTGEAPVAQAAPAATGAYAMLALAILIWSGNFVVGRWANLDVPPVALSFWRHVLAAALVLPFVIGALRRDWPVVRSRLGTIVVMALFFVAGNTFVYFSILHTSVVNAALINAGEIPASRRTLRISSRSIRGITALPARSRRCSGR